MVPLLPPLVVSGNNDTKRCSACIALVFHWLRPSHALGQSGLVTTIFLGRRIQSNTRLPLGPYDYYGHLWLSNHSRRHARHLTWNTTRRNQPRSSFTPRKIPYHAFSTLLRTPSTANPLRCRLHFWGWASILKRSWKKYAGQGFLNLRRPTV